MKHSYGKLFVSVLLMLVCFHSIVRSQEVVNVINEKAGKLSKVLDDKEVSSIIALNISGPLNSDDFAYLSKFQNLSYLDIRGALLTRNNEKKSHRYVEFENSLTLPHLPNIQILALPSTCNRVDIRNSGIKKFRQLIIPSTCYINGVDKSVNAVKVYLSASSHEEEDARRNFKGDDLRKNYLTRYFYQNSDGSCRTGYSASPSRISVDTLFIGSAINLQNRATSFFDPCFIQVGDFQLVLNRYTQGITQINDVDLIMEGAFVNSNIQQIKLPPKITTVENYTFAGCKELSSVVFNDSIKYIGRAAFGGTAIADLVLPASLQYVSHEAFKGCHLKYCKLQSVNAPIVTGEVNPYSQQEYKDWKKVWENCVVEIPEGSYESYQKNKFWNMISLSEQGVQRSYNITLEKPGTILSHLPLNGLAAIDSLTISGFLYDTDANILKKCTSLKYIDLRHAFISESPETQRAKQEEVKIFSAYTQLMGLAGEMAYQNNEISSMQYLATKGLAELGKAASEFKEADNNCFVPSQCFINLKQLKVAKLPLRAVSIGHKAFAGCSNLECVELPPYMKVFGREAFADCTRLRIDKFPNSITGFYDHVFARCTSLKKVDLSNCTIKGTFYLNIFEKCQLEELRLPNGIETVESGVINGYLKYNNSNVIKNIYFPATLKNMKATFYFNCNLHFKSPTPPITIFGNTSYKGEGNTIYVPKNCTTAYYSAFGDSHSYKEE